MPPPLRAEVRQVGWEAGVVLRESTVASEGIEGTLEVGNSSNEDSAGSAV